MELLATLKEDLEMTEKQFSVLARNHVEPNVVHAHIIQFGQKEIGYHQSVALDVGGNGLTNVVFEKVRTKYAASPKSVPNNKFLQVHCYLVNIV